MTRQPTVKIVGRYTLNARKIRRRRVAGGVSEWQVPKLTISGRALELAGFGRGDQVVVTMVRPGALVVQRVTRTPAAAAVHTRRP